MNLQLLAVVVFFAKREEDEVGIVVEQSIFYFLLKESQKREELRFHKKVFRVSNPKIKLRDAESVFFLFLRQNTHAHFFTQKTHYFSKMTINDHDQFTGLNAVHVAASEGNVKKLVELMDDGAELDVPALGGAQFTHRDCSFFFL